MHSLTNLTALVEKYAAAIPDLNFDGDEQEEYSTMLLWLQNQVETGQPSESIVRQCLPSHNLSLGTGLCLHCYPKRHRLKNSAVLPIDRLGVQPDAKDGRTLNLAALDV